MKKTLSIILSLCLILICASCNANQSATRQSESSSVIVESHPDTPIEDLDYSINNGTVTIEGYTGTDREIYIPAMIKDRPVTVIGEEAFQGYDLISITLPASVTTIEASAFSECLCLETVTLHDGLQVIDDYAFEKCSALHTISLPSTLSSLGDNAFYQCASLTEIRIPSGVNKINFRTFYQCNHLRKITLSDGLEEINMSAFEFCHQLESLTIPKTVTLIYESVSHWGVKELEIPQNAAITVNIVGYGFADPGEMATVNQYTVNLPVFFGQGLPSLQIQPTTVMIVSEGSPALQELQKNESHFGMNWNGSVYKIK